MPDTDVMIRFATVADAEAIAEIHVDTWRAAYAGIVPSEYLAALSKTKRAEGWRRGIVSDPRSVLLAEENSQVRGWIAVGKCWETANPAEAEVYAFYVRPERWRGGLGRSLLKAAEEKIWSRGFTWLLLWVLEGNSRARAFYEAMGFTLDGQKKGIAFGAVTLVELRYVKKKLTPEPEA